MADIDDIVDFYVNLLIIQYNDQPKARATVDLFIREALADGIFLDIKEAYNLDTAVGIQLDVIGKYVGVDRYYVSTYLSGYFALTPYDEVTPDAGKRGFTDYTSYTTQDGRIITYADVVSVGTQLTDDDFRFLIRLRIVQNNSNHSHKSIDDSIYKFFGNDVRPDSLGNMHMYYFVDPGKRTIANIAFQKGLFPKPMGVSLQLIEETSVFFGFTSYDVAQPFVTGFSTYADYGTKVGETLKYDKLVG